MKRLLILLTLLVAVSALSFGASCATASFAVYDAGGFSCTIDTSSGTLTFSNFTLFPALFVGAGTGVAVPDTNITVTPFGANSADVGFIFTSTLGQGPNSIPSFFASGSQLAFLPLAYIVNSTAGIVGATSASVSATDTGNGSSSVTKDIFNQGTLPASSGGSTYATANVNDVVGNSGMVYFTPVTTFAVRDTLSLQANNGSSAVTSFRNDFFVPEPATLGLAGIAFVGLALIGRRKKKV